nr:MAG TPA: hypothetical protein [Caudoviricetes sp.]
MKSRLMPVIPMDLLILQKMAVRLVSIIYTLKIPILARL